MRYFYLLLFLVFISCKSNTEKASTKTICSIANLDETLEIDTAKEKNYMEEVMATLPENPTPIMGYRFFIEGDFDGDGKKETLTEHFVSGIDGKETNKRYSSLTDQSQLIVLQDKKEPYSFILSSNSNIDTLRLEIQGGGQFLGLQMLRNEGDLNGDGRDEISLISGYADWSSINSIKIYTFTKKGWKLLNRTICYDSDAPELYDIELPEKDWDKPVLVNVNNIKTYKSRIQKLKKGIIAVKSYGEGMAYDTRDTVTIPLKIK